MNDETTARAYYTREYNECVENMRANAKLATDRTKNFPTTACFYQEQSAKWATRMFTCKLLYDRVGKANTDV